MNSTLLPPRQEVIVANHILQACVCFYGLIWLIFVLLETKTYTETVPCCRRGLNKNGANVPLLVTAHITSEKKKSNAFLQHILFGNSMMSLLFLGILGLMSFRVPFTEDCTLFGRFVSAMYTLTAQTTLMFLNEKTLLVGDFAEGWFYPFARRTASIAIWVFIPLGILPLGVYFTVGMLLQPEQICTIVDISNFIGYVFAAGNFMFSCMLMYLFVEPLRQNAVRMRQGNRALSNRIVKVAIRNTYLAVISLGSSTAVSILFSIFSGFVKGENKRNLEFLCIVNMILASTDITIIGICNKAMSTLWMPHSLKTWLYPPESETSSRDSKKRRGLNNATKKPQTVPMLDVETRTGAGLMDKHSSISLGNQFSFLVMSGGEDGDSSSRDERGDSNNKSYSSFTMARALSQRFSQLSLPGSPTLKRMTLGDPALKSQNHTEATSSLEKATAPSGVHSRSGTSSLTTAEDGSDDDEERVVGQKPNSREATDGSRKSKHRASSVKSADVENATVVNMADDLM